MKHVSIVLVLSALVARAPAAPVSEGLILRLDAAEEAAARQKAALPAPANRYPLERWMNTAGTSLAALQPWAQARPIFRSNGAGEAFASFDGKDDFLLVSGTRRLAPAVTVFILAAARGNPGTFSALYATAEAGKNDYTSGLNLDLGPVPTREMSVLNLESAGASGIVDFLEPARNLASELPFGAFHVFTVRSRIGERGNELFLDGVRLGERNRLESHIGLDEMVIGGRLYSNDPAQPPHAQGCFQGDLAAVLVYERALPDAERESVEQELFARIPALNALAAGSSGHAWEVLDDPPVVQILVPGFAVDELPLRLSNLTNIRYRHDGRLVALGYDGRIHLLSDGAADGLEDQAAVFWDQAPLRAPIGMALLPAGDPRGDGLFVASKAKVSLILDRDRDGRADEERVVASGWKETFHGVDTLGVAVDPRDGAIYFSIGCENFADAYLRDPATGKSAYRLDSDRGTVQRLAPDFSRRERIATGVRFACALAFNHDGDLFATEQEGATWLPNGNPLDELLHIVPGRHYGFPPRHPRHLPQVVDEPAVMEYGPQHQSTVGMVFNESVNGGPGFGPPHWEGDALICGESRGKLYRTKLVKTPAGYVGQNQLLACLSLLTVDACVSPRGDLLIACHSGPPDWGTGPPGDGRIFRVRHARRETPQVVWAWAAAPDEFRIAFDRPLEVGEWAGAREKIRIEAGRHVSAGDRYEVIRPGYQVVREQMGAPRRWVDVHGLSLSADRRTLILRLSRQTEAAGYAITLPVPDAWRAEGGIPGRPEMDVTVTLHGVEAALDAGGETLRVVLPHPSFPVAKAMTAGSSEHAEFFRRAAAGGASSRLTLRGGIDAANIFVPATQPGSTLDWDPADDPFAQRMMAVRQDFSTREPREVALGSAPDRIRPFQLALSGEIDLGGGLTFALDDQTRPVPLHRLFVPWARAQAETDALARPAARADLKGNWLRGRRLYFGAAACSTCHAIRGEGTPFGPDLTNLVHRDRDSVLRDLLEPAATINPDHTGSLVWCEDGTVLSGLLQAVDGERVIVRVPAGETVERPRREVAAIEPMKTSLMPEGLERILTPDGIEDLITFLLGAPLEPAPLTRLDPAPPPARTRAEITPFLPPGAAAPAEPQPLRVLLAAGQKDHGIDEHDYPLWLERWSRLLSLADRVTVATAGGFPTREELAAADVTVFNSSNPGWDADRAALLDEYQRRGGGLVYLHWSIEGHRHAEALAERVGFAFSASKFRHGPMELVFPQTGHPITRGFTRLPLLDEAYWALRGDAGRVSVLATSEEEGAPRPQLWTLERHQGRVFGCIPGHYTWTFDDPLYRLLVLRGIAWAARQEDVHRLAELATIGARVAP